MLFSHLSHFKAVCADGAIVRTGGRARKVASGYDLTRLFIGSEGMLGDANPNNSIIRFRHVGCDYGSHAEAAAHTASYGALRGELRHFSERRTDGRLRFRVIAA